MEQRDLNVVMLEGYLDLSALDALYSIEYLINKKEADIVLGPEYYLSSLPLDWQSKEAIVETLKKLSEGKDTLLIPGSMFWGERNMVKNTAFVISDGKVLLEYDKRVSAESDKIIAAQLGLYPVEGSTKGLFRWNGDECGIGICADCHELRYDLGGPLDFQFLVSGDAYLDVRNEDIVVREGGHFIRCDSKIYEQEIKTRTKDSFCISRSLPSKIHQTCTVRTQESTSCPLFCNHAGHYAPGNKNMPRYINISA